MTRRLLVSLAGLVAVAAAIVGFAGPASAGGWAITTLDPLPATIEPGQVTPIGYTIRQHGVTPVTIDATTLVVTLADGRALRFPGTPDGPTGHYVATVTVPEPGQFALSIEQGWFGPQDLGHVTVGTGAPVAAAAPAAGSSGGAGGAGGWPWAVKGLLSVATAAALVVLGREIGTRRRRPVVA
jgi:hypothetical protein